MLTKRCLQSFMEMSTMEMLIFFFGYELYYVTLLHKNNSCTNLEQVCHRMSQKTVLSNQNCSELPQIILNHPELLFFKNLQN